MKRMNPNITGIILAGGKSQRMGQEKGLVLHQNIPFILHIIKAIENLVDTIMIITSNTAYSQFGYPCFEDQISDCGPVGGIYTGLSHTNTAQNLILSCDVPFISEATISTLLAAHTEAHQITHYENTPLVGCYPTTVRSVFKTHLEQKQLRLQKVLASVSTKTITISEKIAHTIQNINTLEEYKNAMTCK